MKSIEIENKICNVKLDTGADVNVIPFKLFKHIGKGIQVRNTNYVIKAFEGTVAKPYGTVNLHCKYKNKNIFADFVIAEGVNQVLLGAQMWVNLNLIKRINNVRYIETNLDKEQYIKDNEDIFSGSLNFLAYVK